MDADGVTGMMLHVSSDGRRARGGVGGQDAMEVDVSLRDLRIFFFYLEKMS